MTRRFVSHGDVVQAEYELEGLRETYLLRFGWKPTCQTPGAYWLWRRDFEDVDVRSLAAWEGGTRLVNKPVPYGVVTVSQNVAISMTVKTLDECPQHPCPEKA